MQLKAFVLVAATACSTVSDDGGSAARTGGISRARYRAEVSRRLRGAGRRFYVAADLNGDRRIDIVCIGASTANLKWYENTGPAAATSAGR